MPSLLSPRGEVDVIAIYSQIECEIDTLRRSIIVPGGGLTTSTGGVLVVLAMVFVVPGVVLVVIGMVASHYGY